jgi:hypothetical protein
VHFLARLVADVELALEDDLHLVVGVRVDERRAGLESVEAAGERLFGIVDVAGPLVIRLFFSFSFLPC